MLDLAELDRLIHLLTQLRAEQAAREKTQVIAELRRTIAQHHLTAAELGLRPDPAPVTPRAPARAPASAAAPAPAAPTPAAETVSRPALVLLPTPAAAPPAAHPLAARDRLTPRCRDEAGNVWHGGRGRRPAWVRRLVAAGDDLERYRVPAA